MNEEENSKTDKSNANDDSHQNRTHTLHTFSESYIHQLSKKLKEKTNQSFKDQENLNEENENDKEEDEKSKKTTKSLMNLNSAKNNRTEPLLKMLSCPRDVLREDSIKKENEEGNPLINEFFNDSGNTTKKEGSHIEEEEPQKLEVS